MAQSPPRRKGVQADPVVAALARAREAGLWAPGDRILVAASGGADSTALAHALAQGREALGLGGVVLGHVDHGLRPESGRDADVLVPLAAAQGLDLLRRKVRVEGGGGLQAAARRARYQALEALRQEASCELVATAHTASDQAETVLLRLLRGSAPAGLRGVRRRRGTLVRPLLEVHREQTRAYCRDHGLAFVDDPANVAPSFARVRVRTELLPLLEARFNPALVESLCRLARLAEDEAELLSEQADALRARLADAEGGLSLAGLREAPPALARRVLAEAWRAACASREEDVVEADHVERLLAAVRAPTRRPRRYALPGGVWAHLRRGRLRFLPRPEGEGVR